MNDSEKVKALNARRNELEMSIDAMRHQKGDVDYKKLESLEIELEDVLSEIEWETMR